MKELSSHLKTDLMWIVSGSLMKGNYIHGKSDIDLIVLKKNHNGGELPPSAFLYMNELGKKFGTVEKHERQIGIFDVMIFMNCNQQKLLRRQITNELNVKVYYTDEIK
jgi:hypothetical protein